MTAFMDENSRLLLKYLEHAVDMESSSRILIENLADITDMIILNTAYKCKREVTWSWTPLKPVIDYALYTNTMSVWECMH